MPVIKVTYLVRIMINLHFDHRMLAVESVLSRVVELDVSRIPSHLVHHDELRGGFSVRLSRIKRAEASGRLAESHSDRVVLDLLLGHGDGPVRRQEREG